MQTAINSRAKLPADLRRFCEAFNITPKNILSTNPKTEKNKVQTYILHLAPAETSGVNVCPNAQNCKAICLHFAGNPVYMNAKQAARIRRTQALHNDQQRFIELLVCAIADKIRQRSETIAIRLNGTSDICWENLRFKVSPEFSRLLNVKYGLEGNFAIINSWSNIFELFNHASNMAGRQLVKFYDYTKLSRNWKYCQDLGYHLTFSFDGWDNALNLKIARRALLAGVNVAAAFNIKRGGKLPDCIDATPFNLPESATFTGHVLAVIDGDLTDYRPSDAPGGHIVGLRFKRPHGAPYTAQDVHRFCIA